MTGVVAASERSLPNRHGAQEPERKGVDMISELPLDILREACLCSSLLRLNADITWSERSSVGFTLQQFYDWHRLASLSGSI
jgi:hypothetical protein